MIGEQSMSAEKASYLTSREQLEQDWKEKCEEGLKPSYSFVREYDGGLSKLIVQMEGTSQSLKS